MFDKLGSGRKTIPDRGTLTINLEAAAKRRQEKREAEKSMKLKGKVVTPKAAEKPKRPKPKTGDSSKTSEDLNEPILMAVVREDDGAELDRLVKERDRREAEKKPQKPRKS